MHDVEQHEGGRPVAGNIRRLVQLGREQSDRRRVVVPAQTSGELLDHGEMRLAGLPRGAGLSAVVAVEPRQQAGPHRREHPADARPLGSADVGRQSQEDSPPRASDV